jgi:3-oxoacyl-(acyl-carrier-protein) synthase
MSFSPRLAVTGLGSVSPFGSSVDELLEGLASGRSCVEEVEPTGRPGRRIPVLPCRGFDATRFLPAMKVRRWDACSRLATVAALQALTQAGIASVGAERLGILTTTWSAGATPLADFITAVFRTGPESAPPMLFPYTVANAPGSQAAIELGLKGPIATLSHRAAVFADSLLFAGMLLEDRRADAIVVVATDEVNPTYLRAWDDLGIVEAPGREGFILGEGGYALVLERIGSATDRGARIRGVVSGIGFVNGTEGPHHCSHDPQAWSRAMTDAIARANRSPGQIDFVVLSENGRRPEAEVERQALSGCFGPFVPPTVRWKRALGEGAAPSAAQCLAAIASVDRGRLAPDRGGALPAGTTPAPSNPRIGLVNFHGGGGTVFSVVVERAPEGMDTVVLPPEAEREVDGPDPS